MKDLGQIDGVDQWNALQNKGSAPRKDMLVELNTINGNEAVISWPWKLVKCIYCFRIFYYIYLNYKQFVYLCQ